MQLKNLMKFDHLNSIFFSKLIHRLKFGFGLKFESDGQSTADTIDQNFRGSLGFYKSLLFKKQI